ncbi:MAG: sporulation protein [Defluviitaleaceae bacterium]|nr:sporulation protein [Defluviitaleaceae bacterium]
MSTNNVNEHLHTLFSKMEGFISTKTVVGEAVHFGEIILVPLVDVTFGVGACMTDKPPEKKGGDMGGGGLGAKLTPAAVIVIVNGTVQLVNVKNQESVNKLIDLVPGILTKLNLGNIFKKKENEETE